MLKISRHEQIGMLSTLSKDIVTNLNIDGNRLINDLAPHLNQELDNFIKNINLNKYIESYD